MDNNFSKLVELLKLDKLVKIEENIVNNIEKFLSIEKCSFDEIYNFLQGLNLPICSTDTSDEQWKFVCVISYIILKIVEEVKENDVLSVNEQKYLKQALIYIISLGMIPSFIPGVGLPTDKRGDDFKSLIKPLNLPILEKYSRLKFTCNFITRLCEENFMKMIILPTILSDYLCGMFQLAYAPLSKPNPQNIPVGDFIMTEEKYAEFIEDQLFYQNAVKKFTSDVFPPIVIKELIILLGIKVPKPPIFMIKVLSKQLSEYLLAQNGVLYIIKCFFDAPHLDIGAQWTHIEKLTQLLSVKHGQQNIEEYLKNISEQLTSIIKHNKSDYVGIAAACLSNIHNKYPENPSINNTIQSILLPITIDNDNHEYGELKTSSIELNRFIDILEMCFCQSKYSLSAKLLTPIIYNMFCIRSKATNLKSTSEKLDNLILKHFKSQIINDDDWFSCLIFNKTIDGVDMNSKFYLEGVKDGIHLKYSNTRYKATVEDAVNTLLEIIMNSKDNGHLMACKMFLFCLSSLNQINSQATKKNKKDLLLIEDEPCDLIDKNSEHLLIFLKSLEHLSNIDAVLNFFKNDPSLISNFIVDIFKNSQDDQWFIQNEECISISLVLLSAILSDGDHNVELKKSLSDIQQPLENLVKKCTQPELKLLCQEVLDLLFGKMESKSNKNTAFELALKDVCDPLLPVRAHGLIELNKLVVKRDAETISKKHYVLCIFQENIQHEDSYIYLNAIRGLASLANYFTEEVLSVLCREFINVTNKTSLTLSEEDSSIKLRLKIGEILVKTTKQLGEMAPTHKTILLNTFLCSCRDSDELIRASSLSNLAELCNILNYKLGSIIYEILKCVHEAIETEKSLECKRAAVLVISSLLKGLGSEALSFLKESLLPIYRTLKKLYHNEKEDSVVRLHAQLGLEELNDIVKNLMMPKLQLQKEIFIPSPM